MSSETRERRSCHGRELREHKLRSRFSQPGDFVFASEKGTGLDQWNVTRRALDPAVRRAGLDDGEPLTFHAFRHLYGSLLLAEGESLVDVAGQMGHADASITAKIYAHPVDQEARSERRRARLEAAFGTVVETAGGDEWRTDVPVQAASVAEIGSAGALRLPVAAGGD